LRRNMLRLLRRRPLLVMTTIMMALAAGAITVTSAAGLALVEPHDRAYPVSLLSVLEANYASWPGDNPAQRRLDPAIIAEAARVGRRRGGPARPPAAAAGRRPRWQPPGVVAKRGPPRDSAPQRDQTRQQRHRRAKCRRASQDCPPDRYAHTIRYRSADAGAS